MQHQPHPTHRRRYLPHHPSICTPQPPTRTTNNQLRSEEMTRLQQDRDGDDATCVMQAC
ncbi:predicted protein [Plenodomus lingam JN3]|uniref:Predicted protein n=1 Tax=Leptosphaeria maculans (strain JN3 / isolate v23.1.3 / race Av1-4-5-6-7-8) TaxID=985895 RepID=E4ZZ23_LEPMJ|nr:predicted protein [Plenodomus lingam JN3]CBX96458.1 predicted protein [Plenodomus lingam JN3]